MELFHCLSALFFLLEQSLASSNGICQNFKFVIDEDDIPEHALEGHVFKNSTVDKATHCHMMCRDDCRCISMNYIHNKPTDNCQLNDVNKEMKPAALKHKAGASYYDLVREYKVHGRSFVHGRDRCINRCCQTNPCLQGGTCEEICDPTTVRFNCTCPAPFTGQRCEKLKHPRSCKDLETNGAKISGMHYLYDSQNNLFPVYCDFESEAGFVWVLTQSFSLANKNQFNHGFYVDHAVNEDDETINWNAYRLSLSRMQSIADVSTHLRATCNFRKDGLIFTDYARAKLEGHDLLREWSGATCRTYELVNIRGNECQNCTAATFAKSWRINSYGSHSINGCQFNGRSGSVKSEQNFGRYRFVNPAFRCTSSQQSTTQHWIGSKLP